MTESSISGSLNRIDLIDAFRGLAILLVIFFHYYYRFAPPLYGVNLYPYESVQFPLVSYGFYGVQLFFIISGFVIHQSLEKSSSYGVFLKHRFVRLFPAMFLCSLLTFLFVNFVPLQPDFDSFKSKTVLNFLPSLTFTTPIFWNFLLGRNDIQYIDGVYWSLWTEVFFYLSATLIFFVRRKNFLMTWLMVTMVLQILRIITSPKFLDIYPDDLVSLADTGYRAFFVFNLNYWVYFSIGIFMYALYSKKSIAASEKLVMTFLIALEYYFLNDLVLMIFFTGFIILCVLLVYRPGVLSPLRVKPLLIIGLASYPLYLLHQNIGLILISKFSLESHSGINIFISLLVLLFLITLSYLIYQYFEKPIIKFFR